MARLIPKQKKLKKKKLLLPPLKKESTSPIFQTFIGPSGQVNLDQNRFFFYSHSLKLIGDLGGLKWITVFPKNVEIITVEDKKVIIPLLVLCSRNRMYANEYIKAVCCGKNPDNLIFEMDQYDIELSKILKGKVNAD